MSGAADLSEGVHSGVAVPGGPGVLRVEVAFHDVVDEQADVIAAELIARAHELANLPEHGCDVDVNVRREPSGTGGAGSV